MMNSPNNANQQTMFIVIGLGVLLFIGAGVGFFFMRGMSMMMLLPFGIFGIILILGLVFVAQRGQMAQSQDDVADWLDDTHAKNKHADDVDMYSLIDDLVADLTEDEARYLMRKLDDYDRQKLTTNIEDLLEERRRNRS